MELIDRDLSEPYSIFTYRYFVAQWPTLCFLAVDPTGGQKQRAGGGERGSNDDDNSDDNPSPPQHQPPVLLPDNEGAAAGVVVCKAEPHRDRGVVRGYLAMLVVDRAYRGKGLGGALARRALRAMDAHPCDEIALEAEAGNGAALALYRSLGFIRDKRLHRYYLNGADAFRLKLLLPRGRERLQASREERLLAAMGEGAAEGEDEEGAAAEAAAEALAGMELAPR
jgi:N-alpha-acetyltransferase 30